LEFGIWNLIVYAQRQRLPYHVKR